MQKKEIAEKFLSPRLYEVWNRTEIKKSNEYKEIAITF
jgi:hypothetical protein